MFPFVGCRSSLKFLEGTVEVDFLSFTLVFESPFVSTLSLCFCVMISSPNILQVYIPSGLVVLIACLSFWIDQNAVPARITLGLVSVVTIATQVIVINKNNIDARNSTFWMCLCILFNIPISIFKNAVNKVNVLFYLVNKVHLLFRRDLD